MVPALKSNERITLFSPSTSSSNETIRAKVLHINMIVHHNLPFLLADHLAKNYAAMFPDSKIAKKFACSYTKTCILNKAMMPELTSYLKTYMQNETFSLVNDGSSDTGLKKMNATCALIFDVNRSKKVEFKFYQL